MTIQTNMINRIKYALLAFSIIFTATTLDLAQNKSLPNLRGKEAVESLKKNGQYDSLIDAVKAAREKDGQSAETPTEDAVGQSARLTAADGAADDALGASVAISGDTAIVGAEFDTVDGITVRGSAYIFVRSGTVWTQQAKLIAPDGANGDVFGNSVAISGDTAIVGAPRDDVGANAEQGSAYVFNRSGTVWTLQQQLTAPDGGVRDFFGNSVAISGDTAIIGAPLDTVGANAQQGSAYVFTRAGTVWTQVQQLTSVNGAAGDLFGYSVAISGETVIFGAVGNGAGANNAQGSAYIFVRSGTVWTEQQKLIAADGAAYDQFGTSVAISGDTAIVGAFQDDFATNNQGSAYVFTRAGTVWTDQQKLKALGGTTVNWFGASVAISGETAVVGSRFDTVGANQNQGSAYVFTRAGTVWTQQQRLTAADGAAGDFFGYSVAMSGNNIIVGAYQDDVGANVNQGSAYAFRNLSSLWMQEARKVAADGAAGDFFGASVAISGDTAIVGAYQDDVGANGDQGSAYIFVRSGTIWTEQQQLTASDGAAGDFFGRSVAISGDTAIVGAFQDDVGANTLQGSAYIFVRSGTVWTQQTQLIAADGAVGNQFGYSVAISGNTAIVGAYGDQNSAYVFTRAGTVWSQQQKLTAADGAAGDQFGISVAISGNTAIVGSRFDTVGANTLQGSAHIFVRSGTVWTEQQQLTASDGATGDLFGNSVAISGDTAVVGASFDDVGANINQGSAYVFSRSGTVWSQQQQLTASDGAAGDFFGWSVAISGDTAIVGSHGDDVGATPDQGSAYVFTRAGTVWSQQQKLTTADGAAYDQFGYSVGISGDKIIVGAPLSDLGFSSPLNSGKGDGNDLVPSATDQGAVYMFVNTPLAPTAANISISGRIFTPEGASLRNAVVYLTKPDGTTVSTRSTSFGYYRFENLAAGGTYVIGVNSKLYTFAPQIVQALDNLADIDFTAFE